MSEKVKRWENDEVFGAVSWEVFLIALMMDVIVNVDMSSCDNPPRRSSQSSTSVICVLLADGLSNGNMWMAGTQTPG